VFAWITEKHPEQIPASIKALSPGNLDEAFSHYFMGKQRGYLTA